MKQKLKINNLKPMRLRNNNERVGAERIGTRPIPTMPVHNKGITLVALIITIIILLILAVVAISAVKGDGIIAHAKNAKTQYSEAQKNEQELLSNYELMLAQETGNAWKQEKTKVTKGDTTLNVGDTITNFTAGNRTWKVLGAENGKLLLTTEEGVLSTSVDLNWDETENRFVEAENAWDAECAKILTDEEKVQVTAIRSMKVEDINRVTGYDPKTAENGKPFGAGEIYQYGNEVTYSVVKDENGTVTGVKYESKNVANKSGISTNHTQFYAQNTTENITSPYTVTSTYYYYDVDSDANLGPGSSAYQMLFGGDGYYLSSSYVITEEGIAIYGMYMVTRRIEGNDLGYSATGSSFYPGDCVYFRPVVSLSSDFQPAK